MKTIVTFFFILFITTAALAQNNATQIHIEDAKQHVEMNKETKTSYKLNTEIKTELTRLYKFKNARITKELSFLTKKSKPKMA